LLESYIRRSKDYILSLIKYL